MTFKKLVRELCKREKLKKQVDAAQVTELLGHLADIVYEEYVQGNLLLCRDTVEETLVVVGLKRAKKKAKKK
jgi:hypothetical protein